MSVHMTLKRHPETSFQRFTYVNLRSGYILYNTQNVCFSFEHVNILSFLKKSFEPLKNVFKIFLNILKITIYLLNTYFWEKALL